MAARGETIIISTEPCGKFLSGVVSGTPKPGTLMEIMTPFHSNGRHRYRAYQPGTDGERRMVIVLLEDNLQGKLVTDAYTNGSWGRFYVPAAGEELNMLIGDVVGTGDDHPAGELLMADTGTGKLVASTGSPESEPFILLEAVTDPIADFLSPCMYTGY